MQSFIVYEAQSALRHPSRLLRQMMTELISSRQIAWAIMVRDIRTLYRQSLFGVLWAFVPPIVMAVGFTYAGAARIINVGSVELPYPAYVMFSMSLWQVFMEALNGPIRAVTQSKIMIAKVNFPREALFVAKLGEVGFNFGFKLILIVAVFLWFQIPITWLALLAPFAIIMLALLGTFIGLFLAPFGALYQDFPRMIPVLGMVLLVFTPVVYSMPDSGFFATLVRLNPVTPLLVTARELATTGMLTQLHPFMIVSALTVLGLFLALIVARLAMPYVVERLSS